jgi:hypothetical protein
VINESGCHRGWDFPASGEVEVALDLDVGEVFELVGLAVDFEFHLLERRDVVVEKVLVFFERLAILEREDQGVLERLGRDPPASPEFRTTF